MSQAVEFWRRLLFLIRRNQLDRELQEEMRQHAEWKAQKNIAAGMDPEEARFAARRQLGNLLLQHEASRQSWGFPLLDSLAQDIRYGLRGLRKSPAFTAVAMVTLALGIGATTTIFSIVNTVMLRPLPYKDSSRLIHVWTVSPMFPEFHMGQSKPDFDETRSSTKSFEIFASYHPKAMVLTGKGEPEQISAAAVSPDFFTLFGVTPELGRTFDTADEQKKNGNTILLSHSLWQRRFGGDPNITGQLVIFNQEPYTVVGVLPDKFSFPGTTEAWTPLIVPPKDQLSRTNWTYFTIAKLRSDSSLRSAQTEMDLLAAKLGREYPKDEAGIQFLVDSFHNVEVGQNTRSELIILLGAVTFLLLIGCANVSNLILSRGVQRRREIALRAALGASRRRILRQLLVESLLLAFAGGVAGLLVAFASIAGFRAFAPADFARLSEIHLEPAIAIIAFAVSSIAGVLCGLAPALHSSRSDLNLALKDRTPAATAAPQRFSLRSFLVVAEISLALILLTGSALMLQSLVRLMKVDAGFRTDHLLTAELILANGRYPSPDSQRLFVRRLLDALQAEPQFSGIAMSNNSLLTGNTALLTFDPSLVGSNEKSINLEAKSVTPGFFGTMGIRLLGGRDFDARDIHGTPQVVVINESMARRFFTHQDPVGKDLKFGPAPDDVFRIVGVVSDTRDIHLNASPRLQVYFPLLQDVYNGMTILVRSSSDPLALANVLQKCVWSIDKDLPVNRIRTMDQVISRSVAEPRFRTWLLMVFAITGLTLTLIGIYGVVSYSVSQRTQEMGIRIALGAQSRNVLQLVLSHGVRLALLGAAIGLSGSLLLMRLLASQLFEIKPGDPLTLTGAALLMLAVSLFASYIPARRAARVDPMVALRCE